jgi:hypothetical protein
MTYKVVIGNTKITCTYGNRDLLAYAGLSMKALNNQLTYFAYPKIANALVLIHDPRFRQELYLREQGQGSLDDAKTFLTLLFQEVSENPHENIEVHFIKEKGFSNPEGV